jgi:hypothetical protein
VLYDKKPVANVWETFVVIWNESKACLNKEARLESALTPSNRSV